MEIDMGTLASVGEGPGRVGTADRRASMPDAILEMQKDPSSLIARKGL
ncbi:hypothetical protein [Actinocrispum sp. NPDC049592]